MADTQGQSQSGEKGKGKRKLVIVIIIALLLIAGIAFAAFIALRPKEPKKKAVVTADNAEEVAASLLTETPIAVPQMYTVTQNSEWIFSDGNTASENAYVKNSEDNETPVYIELIVDESGETIYTSPILELGAELRNIKLDKPLEAGSYVCTGIYHLVDDDQNELTTVSVGVTVIVEK